MSQAERLAGYQARQALQRAVGKRAVTATIAALAEAELAFGSLWGHGRRDRTAAEAEWRKVWDLFRARVLDKGNEQARKAEADVKDFFLED
jgi:hypothetical protein